MMIKTERPKLVSLMICLISVCASYYYMFRDLPEVISDPYNLKKVEKWGEGYFNSLYVPTITRISPIVFGMTVAYNYLKK